MPSISTLLFLLLLAIANLMGPSAQAAETSPPAELAARYQTRLITLSSRPQTRQRQWYFLRTTMRVEKHQEDGSLSEIWYRDGNSIRYQRLYPAEKRLLDYTASDLRSLGQYPRWQELIHMLDPAFLDRLTRTGTTLIQGHPASTYKGQLNGIDWEVTWLDTQAIPALIRRVTANQEVSIKLLELYPLDKVPFTKPDTNDFQALDFADLGDNEADPFWARIAHP